MLNYYDSNHIDYVTNEIYKLTGEKVVIAYGNVYVEGIPVISSGETIAKIAQAVHFFVENL